MLINPLILTRPYVVQGWKILIDNKEVIIFVGDSDRLAVPVVSYTHSSAPHAHYNNSSELLCVLSHQPIMW